MKYSLYSSNLCNCDVIDFKAAGSKRKMTKGLDPLSYYEAVKEMKRRRKEEQVKAHL